MALSAAGRKVNPPQRQPVRRLPEYLKLLLPSQLPLFCVCFFFFLCSSTRRHFRCETSNGNRRCQRGRGSGGGAAKLWQLCNAEVLQNPNGNRANMFKLLLLPLFLLLPRDMLAIHMCECVCVQVSVCV